MPTTVDDLVAEARRLQGEMNAVLDELQSHNVWCHSVVSAPPFERQSFAPLPLHRVALVLEFQNGDDHGNNR